MMFKVQFAFKFWSQTKSIRLTTRYAATNWFSSVSCLCSSWESFKQASKCHRQALYLQTSKYPTTLQHCQNAPSVIHCNSSRKKEMHKLKLYRLCPAQWTTKDFKAAVISLIFRNSNHKKITCHENSQQRLACSSHNWGSTNNSVAVCTDNISTVSLNSDLKYAEEDILLCVAGWRLKVLETMWECCNVQPAYASKEAHPCHAEDKASIEPCRRCLSCGAL